MTPDNRQENARNEMAAANDALRVAEAALSLNIFRDAMSRTYYAVFHAARALTLLEGFESKTHGGLLHLFNAHLVRTGKVAAKFNMMLTRLQAYRNASDYAYSFEMSADLVREELEAAREFVAVAAGHLATTPGR